MNIIPFGPPRPKKPKSKQVNIIVEGAEVYGWISADEEVIPGTEIFSVNEEGEYGIPLDGEYTLATGQTIQVINGTIA